MHKHVESFLGRLASDPDLRARFARSPRALLAELALELTAVEAEALAAIDLEAVRAFAESLDARLRRAPRTSADDTGGDPTPTTNPFLPGTKP